jgi:FXSXX-COOH protein
MRNAAVGADASYEADLPDLANLPIDQLMDTPDSALARAYRRVVAEVAGGHEVVAGYVSVVDGDTRPD